VVERAAQLSEKGRAAAIAALVRLGTEEGAAAFVRVLQQFGWPAERYPAMTTPLLREPRFPSLVLPAFASTTIRGCHQRRGGACCFRMQRRGSCRSRSPRARGPGAVDGAQSLLEQLQPLQKPSGIAWRFAEAYADSRNQLALVLDLLGYLGRDEQLLRVLRACEALTDPRPRLFASTSLLRLGEAASKAAISAVASDAETRNLLLDRLIAAENEDLFPKSQLVQAKLAESNMVRIRRSWGALRTRSS
jgi:hypothetical protein